MPSPPPFSQGETMGMLRGEYPSDTSTLEHESPSRDTVEILIVDDEAAVCELVSDVLKHEGYKPRTSLDFDSAIQNLNQRFFPVAIVDIHLPGTNGIALLSYIQGLHNNTQVIIITGDPTIETAREAIRLGACDYISKPFKGAELLTVIERALVRYRLIDDKQRLEKENELYQQALEQLVERRTSQLRESEERYRVLFHHAIDAICLLDIPTGTIRDVNLAASRLIGLPAEKLIGQPAKRFIRAQLDEVFSDIASGKREEWHLDYVPLHRVDKEVRRVQLSIGAIDFQHQKILQVICQDITDKVALIERQRQMEIEFLSDQRLASIGLLASGIAHNINTPLMGIYGLAQIMKMKYSSMAEVEDILIQTERVHQIIQNMMWKSRQDQDKTAQELDISELLREELKFLEADLEFKHNIEKDIQLAKGLPVVRGVYSDFSQSIMNIVRNALDAMWDRDSRKLRIATALDGEGIAVEIEDTGCGIPEEKLDHIFAPFFTTKPVLGKEKENEPTGTGLGLSTARRLLESYNVTFKVDSVIDKGTKFTLHIPVKKPEAVIE